MANKTDYLIIGGGIMGLAVARELRGHNPSASILILEKEDDVARHASGRNSGVLHAGFYYTADSLKAKFCREGNEAMRAYVAKNNLRINDCGKVVVAESSRELPTLHEIFRRGQANGVTLKMVDEKELADIEPNAKTTSHAIYAPTTAVIDPIEICRTLRKELEGQNVRILTGTAYRSRIGERTVMAGGEYIDAGRIINCAGLYADRIARDFGFCQHYTILPFKGIYLRYDGNDKPVKACIYPVPNLNNPFLGAHFSVTVDGQVKIGPTATPAFWRENYSGMQGFRFDELLSIVGLELKLFATDAGNFRTLAINEMRKYQRSYMAMLAARMVKHIDAERFTGWGKPGIRAQLVDTRNMKLVQDFVVEGDTNSTHVLNAVSPAFTSSFPFAKWIVENYVLENSSRSQAAKSNRGAVGLVMSRALVPDLLAPNLRLVFCGTAASKVSAREKAYYAKPGNQFWPALHRIGLTPHLFVPQDYPKLLALGIGLTDLCKTHSGNDDELPEAALDREALTNKIQRYQPTLVAFTSKHGASIYFGTKVEYGLQPETLGKTQFFVLCSTSGRARRFWRENVWEELATVILGPPKAEPGIQRK